MTEFSRLLTGALVGHAGLSAEQLQSLELHFELLMRWNRRLNLTAIRDVGDAVRRHYAECVWFAAQLKAFSESHLGLTCPSVADVGSGGGFPGIPVSIVTDWPVALIESHQRKAVFLSEAARSIEGKLSVIATRAEDVRATFDICLSRAVRPSEVLGLGLAPVYALLSGQDDVPRGTTDLVVPDPWGNRRVAWFHVEQ